MNQSEKYLVNAVRQFLDTKKRVTGKDPTVQDITQRIERSLPEARELDDEATIDVELVKRHLEAMYNIAIEPGEGIDDDGHVQWLEEERPKIDWRFSTRYREYLEQEEGLPPAVIASLDETTDWVLSRLDNPKRPGEWDRRGLVAGQVQSGKTGHYTTLICKALDAGYKLIVVLAGVHNSLRSQTQQRLDLGVIGRDSGKVIGAGHDESATVGVGKISGPPLHIGTFTSVEQAGDFKVAVANQAGLQVGGPTPIVLVVKKNKTILSNLAAWASQLNAVTDDSGRKIIRDVPLLVIDDEADHASVDTAKPKRGQKDDDLDPTTINMLIRKLLALFEQSAYVGYTATPFANIFISPQAEHPDAGQDLFPRSFILRLPTPTNYIGPVRIFGLDEDLDADREAAEPLPILRPVDDYESWMPNKHRKSHVPADEMPETLRNALLQFVIAGAIRAHRGQGRSHNSMLVHVTRFKDVQAHVHTQVKDEWERIRDELTFGDHEDSPLLQRLLHVYEHDTAPTSLAIGNDPTFDDQTSDLPDERELLALAKDVANKTQIWMINGESKEALEYRRHPEGLSIIAIGGDKLSRGLTLEGLTVSYYLRTSSAYDTLLQMGRWFGYRRQYLDVCRLYTTPDLIAYYEAVTLASEELYDEFKLMQQLGKTPENFGLRVLQHPMGLTVTAPNKLRHARAIDLSYANTSIDSVLFKTADSERQQNWAALDSLVARLDPAQIERTQGLCVWRDAQAADVLDFFDAYQGHEAALTAQTKTIADYIRSRNATDRLTHWTVGVADPGSSAGHPLSSLGRNLGLTERAREVDLSDASTYTVKRVGSPSHERVEAEPGTPIWEAALAATVAEWERSVRRNKKPYPPSVPSAKALRHARPPQRGLLLLYALNPSKGELTPGSTPFVGFVASFPPDPDAKAVKYVLNPLALKQLLERDSDDEEDEAGEGGEALAAAIDSLVDEEGQ